MTIIVGAGLGGLVLGQWFKARNIPVTILERAYFPALRNYGITLHRSLYQRLLPVLQENEASFLKECSIEMDSANTAQTFRCHRGRLEDFLRKDLDIRWGQHLKGVQMTPNRVSLEIEDEPTIEGDTLIGADGVHSLLRNAFFVPPYDVFYGRRSITLEFYQHRLQPYMEGQAVMQALHGNVLFQVYVNEYTATAIDLGYTYSRPARISGALHLQDRPTTGADNIPSEFYAELSQYGEKQLGPGFAEVFDSEKVRRDGVLHELMRKPWLNMDIFRILQTENFETEHFGW